MCLQIRRRSGLDVPIWELLTYGWYLKRWNWIRSLCQSGFQQKTNDTGLIKQQFIKGWQEFRETTRENRVWYLVSTPKPKASRRGSGYQTHKEGVLPRTNLRGAVTFSQFSQTEATLPTGSQGNKCSSLILPSLCLQHPVGATQQKPKGKGACWRSLCGAVSWDRKQVEKERSWGDKGGLPAGSPREWVWMRKRTFTMKGLGRKEETAKETGDPQRLYRNTRLK